METMDDIFGGEPSSDNQAMIAELTEFIAIEDNRSAELKAELAACTKQVIEAKEKLYDMMNEAGMKSIKLDNGLTPSLSFTRKYFKAGGVSDEDLHVWLTDNNLGDIIKPVVHWGTLNSTMKEFVEQGNDLPEIINPSDVKGIRLNGKSKFIASRKS